VGDAVGQRCIEHLDEDFEERSPRGVASCSGRALLGGEEVLAGVPALVRDGVLESVPGGADVRRQLRACSTDFTSPSTTTTTTTTTTTDAETSTWRILHPCAAPASGATAAPRKDQVELPRSCARATTWSRLTDIRHSPPATG